LNKYLEQIILSDELVCVTWTDYSVVGHEGWQDVDTIDESIEGGPAMGKTVGFLLEINDQAVYITDSVVWGSCDFEGIGQIHIIPRRQIISIQIYGPNQMREIYLHTTESEDYESLCNQQREGTGDCSEFGEGDDDD